MAAVTICNDFGAPQNKVSHCSTVSPFICHELMGPDAMILVFLMLSFKPTFSLSSFSFIKRLFSSSSLSAIRVVLSAYLMLLIFLSSVLIPSYALSILAFHTLCSADKLNKQGDNILEPVCCSMSNFSCCFLTCIQISQEAGQVIWYSHLFKNFPQFVVIVEYSVQFSRSVMSDSL